MGNGDKSKSYNKHKVKQISWQNPKSYNEAIDSAKYMSKKVVDIQTIIGMFIKNLLTNQ